MIIPVRTSPRPIAHSGLNAVNEADSCLACHSVNASPVIGGTATDFRLFAIGMDLTNDHPVNFDYDAALFGADGELVDPTDGAVAPLLFGGKVQCSSCHDVHDPTHVPFLVMDNSGSTLCLTCHVK